MATPRFLRDVTDTRRVVQPSRANTRTAASSSCCRLSTVATERSVNRRSVGVDSAPVQPLEGILVVELARYLPGAYAGRELLRRGARVVRVEAPEGDLMRTGAPAWDEALRHGKESVVCALPEEAAFVRALCAAEPTLCSRAFAPASPLAWASGRPTSRPRWCTARSPASANGAHAARRPRPQLPGVGRHAGGHGAGLPPVQVADLAAGALTAVAEVLAALLRRGRTGVGGHVVVSMTHASHDLVAHRLGGDPLPRQLTGGLASLPRLRNGRRAMADGRGARAQVLRPPVRGRRLARARSAAVPVRTRARRRAREPFPAAAAGGLASALRRRGRLRGPVWTRAEAAAEFGSAPSGGDAPLGAHTEQWRRELGLAQPSAAGSAKRSGIRSSSFG